MIPLNGTSDYETRPRHLLRSSLITFVFALLVSLQFWWSDDWLSVGVINPFVQYLVLSLFLVIFTMYAVSKWSISRRMGQIDLLELPVWYSLFFVLLAVPFGAVVFFDQSYLIPPVRRVDWLIDGLWIAVVGIVGLWVGYRLAWIFIQSKSTQPPLTYRHLSTKRLVLLYVVIWGVRILQIGTIGVAFGAQVENLGSLSGFNQWLTYLASSANLIVAIVAIQVFRQRWSSPFLWALLVLEIGFIFLNGFMKPLLWLLLILLGALHSTGLRLKSRLWLWLSFAILSVILISMVGNLRPMISTGLIDNRSSVSMLTGVTESIRLSWADGFGASTQILWDWVLTRMGFVQVLGLTKNLTPDVIPYWGVERLLSIPLYIVPRALWPGKPILSTGVFFSVMYMQAPSDTNTSNSPMMFGDLYVSAGWGAVILGMMLWGMLCAWLYWRLKVQPLQQNNVLHCALYIAIAVTIADAEAAYVAKSVGLIQILIVYRILYVWLFPVDQTSPITIRSGVKWDCSSM
jgi:hypothetical protein